MRTDGDKVFECKSIVIAAGGGSFQPKKPPIEGIDAYEGTGVLYAVRRMEAFRDKRILIVGGGDSALDWTVNLQPLAKRLTLLHRRDAFRAAPDTVNKMRSLVADRRHGPRSSGRSSALKGPAPTLEAAVVRHDDGSTSEVAVRRDAAVLRADHEARPDRRLGPEPPREPDPGRHREVRDLACPASSPSATSTTIRAS